MIIYPAIDLKDGQCVRLLRGDMKQGTVYNDNPARQAQEWETAGFSWLHVVDLDGAVKGSPANHHAVRKILKTVKIPVQLGGGIRSLAQAERWLKEGVKRVVIGTAAVREPHLVKDACKKFPGCIAVSIDARGDRIAVDGWKSDSDMDIATMVKRLEGLGVSAIIYTDINRDGTRQGLNMEATINLAKSISVPIIASGGVGSLKDLELVKDAEKHGVEGVIIGRALYDKTIAPAEALEIAG